MLKSELGPFLYQYAKAAATISFSPVADRGALVRDIGITAPSAADTWIVSSKGKEIFRARVNALGNMNLFREDDQAAMPHATFFDVCRQYLNMDPSIPVPLGQTLTVTSQGGATANLFVEFEEHDNSDLSPSLLNHPDGKEWLIPLYTWLAAAQTALGPTNDDTQVAPAWLPGFLIGTMLTSAWKVQLLGVAMEGVGVNTFSGAANHQSTTQTKRILLDSKQLASRTTFGIPNLGAASAAGSANTVFGQTMARFQPWERALPYFDSIFNYPVVLNNGDTCNIQEEFTGDLTGGASYVGGVAAWFARITELV